jgi:hypothetical protein
MISGALAIDIEAHGQREPGVLFEGMVLDGWHRYRACEQIGVEFKAEEYERRRSGLVRYLAQPAPPAFDGEPACWRAVVKFIRGSSKGGCKPVQGAGSTTRKRWLLRLM